MPTAGRREPDLPTGGINELIRKNNLTQPNRRRGQNETPVVSVAVKSDARNSVLVVQ